MQIQTRMVRELCQAQEIDSSTLKFGIYLYVSYE